MAIKINLKPTIEDIKKILLENGFSPNLEISVNSRRIIINDDSLTLEQKQTIKQAIKSL